jgi:hypothetical protein
MATAALATPPATAQQTFPCDFQSQGDYSPAPTGWNRLPSVPNYPVEILEGGRQSSITLVNARPSKHDFFTPPKS